MGNILLIALLGWTNLEGGDHSGSDWSPDTSHIAGYHHNINKFYISAISTICVPPDLDSMWVWGGMPPWSFGDTVFRHYDTIIVCADSIVIDGVLDASGVHWGGPGKAGDAEDEGNPGNGWEGGGGGGGHASNGGNGGSVSTYGGWGGSAYGSSSNFTLEVGGRGGATNDSWNDIRDSLFSYGGGIIVLIGCSSIIINGSLLANGRIGHDEIYDGSGGGAGGSIILWTPGFANVSGALSVRGGKGGNHLKKMASQGGGGGSGGRIKIFATTYDTTGLTYYLQGGAAGSGTGSPQAGGVGTFYLTNSPVSAEPYDCCSGPGIEEDEKVSDLPQFSLKNTFILKNECIEFSLIIPTGMFFEVSLYDIMGRKVEDIVKGKGTSRIESFSLVSETSLSSGCYFLLLKARWSKRESPTHQGMRFKGFCIAKKLLVF